MKRKVECEAGLLAVVDLKLILGGFKFILHLIIDELPPAGHELFSFACILRLGSVINMTASGLPLSLSIS